MSTKTLTRDYAESIATQALVFLSQDERAFEGFLSTTGIDVSEIRSLAEDPHFLGGVLDHLLSQDKLVTEFCEQSELDLELPRAARQSLPGAPLEY